ncbi:MAG: hypothetical protein WCD18_03995 [Thermosynechococcaceae cyanobacterium]
MDNLTSNLKKAFYFGVGLAAYAGEQASELPVKAQELADDLIRRGETTTEEAEKLFNNWTGQSPSPSGPTTDADQPQKIEILSIEDVESDVPPPQG